MDLKLVLVASGLAALIAASVARANVQRFLDPMHDGYRLSYCGAEGSVCGEPVASRWCRAQGFERAVEWLPQPGLDFSTATIVPEDGSICRGARCESFAAISCEEAQSRAYRMAVPAGFERSTVFSPNRRSTEITFAAVEYDVLIPGCQQRELGSFLCESVHEYQHCRTLLKSGKVFGCRAGLAFDGNFAVPIAAAREDYVLELDSTARATVQRGRRGDGRLRGEARFTLRFKQPPMERRDWCLQRDRYLYHPTGPKGGIAEIDATADCDQAIEGRFAPHEDDLLEAYDLCEGTLSWGAELEDSFEIMAGALFHIGSARPDFEATDGRRRIVAPYLTIKAPLSVDCKD